MQLTHREIHTLVAAVDRQIRVLEPLQPPPGFAKAGDAVLEKLEETKAIRARLVAEQQMLLTA